MAKKSVLQEKSKLHPRNRNRDRYNLDALILALPQLKKHVGPNKYGNDSINFSDPAAVRLLNTSILKHYYGIDFWEFPKENLCPPIPGRADYIHYIADLLAESKNGEIPKGPEVKCFEAGIGASCVYPILGVVEYDWSFIGSEIDQKSFESASNIVRSNPVLKDKIDCRFQKNKKQIFQGILDHEDWIDVTICNPPFHASQEDLLKANRRKIKNLTGSIVKDPKLNFSGLHHELITEGGEYVFIYNMIRESKEYSHKVKWFTSLVSKQSNLQGVYNSLDKFGAKQVKTISMGTSNKTSRIVAWSFISHDQMKS